MAIYIDVDKFVAEHQLEADVNCKYRAFLEELKKAPVEDVQPIVHAQWFETRIYTYYLGDYPKSYSTYACSNCLAHTEYIAMGYCHRCGAKMDRVIEMEIGDDT